MMSPVRKESSTYDDNDDCDGDDGGGDGGDGGGDALCLSLIYGWRDNGQYKDYLVF